MERTRTKGARRRAVLVVGLAVGLTIGGMIPVYSASAQKVLFGAHVSPRWGSGQGGAIKHLEGMIGRKFAIANRFKGLSDSKITFAANMVAEGRVPMISWRAVDHKQVDVNRAARIAAGDFDGRIAAFADAVKGIHGNVLVRFAWEMTQGRGHIQYIGAPADFIRAWRHVVTIFRNRGATNARFVWAPQARSFCNGKGQGYYPGDAWVDWIGGSAVPGNTWTSFQELFHCFYPWSAARGKPLLAWFGIRERPGDASWKSTFLRNTASTIANSMPAMRAIVYFNSINGPNNFWADSSAGALNAFRALGCNAHFNVRFGCN